MTELLLKRPKSDHGLGPARLKIIATEGYPSKKGCQVEVVVFDSRS